MSAVGDISTLTAVIAEASRTGIILAVPLVGAGVLAGLLAGIIQGATTISDVSLGFGLRLIAVVGVLLIFGNKAYEMLSQLMFNCLGGL